MNKAKKASLVEGPAYLHIYSPCPTGWRCNPEEALTTARLAVQTKVFPLYEVIDGKYVISRKISKPKPVGEYFAIQRRFRHLTDSDIAYIQQRVDEDYDRLLALAGETPGGEPERAES
jgi:pyruvate ferredoxin oxidoreductase beta subunit